MSDEIDPLLQKLWNTPTQPGSIGNYLTAYGEVQTLEDRMKILKIRDDAIAIAKPIGYDYQEIAVEQAAVCLQAWEQFRANPLICQEDLANANFMIGYLRKLVTP